MANGYVLGGSSNYGAIRQVQCYLPYQILTGIEQIKCENNGRWSDAPRCSLSPTTPTTTYAPKPTECPNPSIQFANGFILAGGNRIGDRRPLVCSNGYRLEGYTYAECLNDGTWRYNGQCVPNRPNCPAVLPPLQNAEYSVVGAEGYEPGAIRRVSCQSNLYRLEGPGWIICVQNGTWTEPGRCVPTNWLPTTILPWFTTFARPTTTTTAAPETGPCICQNFNPSLSGDLLAAAKSGETRNVWSLLRRCANPNTVEANTKWTPLMWAANNEHLQVVQVLLSCQINADQTNSLGSTALMFAAKNGNLTIVNGLSRYGADPNIANSLGATALLFASQSGHADVVRSLLRRGAQGDKQDSDGNSALIWAVRGNHTETVNILLDARVNVNLANRVGDTPLHFAAKGGYLQIITALLNAGANQGATNQQGQTPLSMAQDFGMNEAVILLGGTAQQPTYYNYYALNYEEASYAGYN